MPKCANCQNDFTIYDEDRAFYARLGVPAPTHCPDCRQQRRWAYKNDLSLYPRKCNGCQKDIISMYDPQCPEAYNIYCSECWQGDKWAGEGYGVDYDFDRGFFEQFKELKKKVPRQALINNNSVNSPYCNFADFNKDCYLVSMCNDNEDCYYGLWLVDDKNCVDISYCRKCEFCYECVDCINCYEVFNSQMCNDCSHSRYLFDCRNCHDCLGCTGLRNQEYFIFNKKYSEEEYREKVKSLKPEEVIGGFEELKAKHPRKCFNGAHNTDSSGDYINNNNNSHDCFDAQEVEGCNYCYDGLRTKDSYDIAGFDTMENSLECISAGWGSSYYFSYYCRKSHEIWYCDSCHSCKDCFGCVGLKHKQHYIFNKKYSESEYRQLRDKIINQMKARGEFGEAYPIADSPFAYNEPLVFDYYSLTKEDVLAKGWRWKDEEIKKVDPNFPICVDCGKNFKIIDQEMDFYKKFNLVNPAKCFKCRHAGRLEQRNPRKLWDRKCDKCLKEIKTSYAPDRSEPVYCEECYQKEIY